MYCTGSKEAGNRLLDHWVHGRDALGDDQGLAVGDVVQGRARVTSQYHLREIPSVLINESTRSARAAGLFKITTAPLVLQGRNAKTGRRAALGSLLSFPAAHQLRQVFGHSTLAQRPRV